MKSIIITIGLFAFFGCNNSKKPNLDLSPLELEYRGSFYKNDTDTIQFVRFIKDSAGIRKISGQVTFDSNYNSKQVITGNEPIQELKIKEFEIDLLNQGFRNKFDEKNYVMFVQLQPKNNNPNLLEVLDQRFQIESKIDHELSQNGIGKCIAGDLGPGGANMLYEVTDWDKSFQLVTELLNSEGVLNNCLITKRLYIADDDWLYEIVYPIDFEGIFNAM